MQRVIADHVEHDTLSVIRATAAALGLPLLVLETRDDAQLPTTPDPAAGPAPGALVLVLRRSRREASSHAKPRLAVARDVEAGAQQDAASPSSSRVSGEGGIVRFTFGGREGRMAS